MSKETPKTIRDVVRDFLAALLQVPTGNAHEQVDQLTDEEVEQLQAIADQKAQVAQKLRDVKHVLTAAYERRRAAAAKEAQEKASEAAARREAAELLKEHGKLTHAQAIAAVKQSPAHAQALVTAADNAADNAADGEGADGAKGEDPGDAAQSDGPREPSGAAAVDPTAADGEARSTIDTGDVTTPATG